MIKKAILGFVIVIVGFYFIDCSSNNQEKVIEIRDNKGRVTERRITDYDCCEGLLEKIVRFDTLGNIVSEVGSLDNSRFRVEYFYDATGNLEGERHYEWLTDNNVNDSLLTVDKSFTLSGQDKSVKIVSYYLDDWDTLSYEKLVIAQSGDTISWTLHFNERIEYEWGDSTLTAYKVCKTYSDKTKGTTDTLSLERIIPRRYHRSDI